MSRMSFNRNLRSKLSITNVRLFEYRNKMYGIYREAKKPDSDYYTYVLYELAIRKVAMKKSDDHDHESSRDLMNRFAMEMELKELKDE